MLACESLLLQNGRGVATVITRSLRDIHPGELKGLVKEIPTLPAIYQQLFRMMQNPDISVPQVAEVIAKDQALTAKILHLVNSAFCGLKREIRTISRAVVILGFAAVRDAALAISVFDYFQADAVDERRDLVRFWEHSIAVASINKVLARQARLGTSEEAFVAGLLHDAGKLVMKRYFPADVKELSHHNRTHRLTWHEGERQLFLANHATIARSLFRAWSFPHSLVCAIHKHHEPSANRLADRLAPLTYLADLIAYRLDMGAPGSRQPSGCDPAAAELLGFSLDEALQLRENFREEIRQALSILELVA